jgi:hypothetical protein
MTHHRCHKRVTPVQALRGTVWLSIMLNSADCLQRPQPGAASQRSAHTRECRLFPVQPIGPRALPPTTFSRLPARHFLPTATGIDFRGLDRHLFIYCCNTRRGFSGKSHHLLSHYELLLLSPVLISSPTYQLIHQVRRLMRLNGTLFSFKMLSKLR